MAHADCVTSCLDHNSILHEFLYWKVNTDPYDPLSGIVSRSHPPIGYSAAQSEFAPHFWMVRMREKDTRAKKGRRREMGPTENGRLLPSASIIEMGPRPTIYATKHGTRVLVA